MIYIEPNSADAAFCLAAEEYITRNFDKFEEPVFMFWRTEKCVVIGRSQIAAAEVDLQAAHFHNVQIFRRSSGGGAMFSDPGNIMYSLITAFDEFEDPKKIEYEKLIGPMTGALNKMGIPAVSEGRNDITVEGTKISGLAQYAVKKSLCTHGTLLYEADLDMLARVLKPDDEKVSSKALKSVRARVTRLYEYFDSKIPAAEFFERLKSFLFEETKPRHYDLTKYDMEQIDIIRAEKYSNPEWIHGSAPKFSFKNSKRFPAGRLEVLLDAERGIIKKCKIFGDFLGILPLEELEQKLTGLPHEFAALAQILKTVDLRLYLGGIKPEEFMECLL
ncbi:MAG: lipoate--protein ligase [Oscillospiraceae bacterium]|nr:lipoate--protein ligase [Oscillospiraceae bacterium]